MIGHCRTPVVTSGLNRSSVLPNQNDALRAAGIMAFKKCQVPASERVATTLCFETPRISRAS